jgi:Sec-independent protein translocase protein TatA
LPELARAAGSSISQFKKGLKDEERLEAGADEKGAKKELP